MEIAILIVGERIEVYTDRDEAYTAERNYLAAGIRQRQLRVTTVQIAVPSPFTVAETATLNRALWDSIARIDRRNDELLAGGVSAREVYDRRQHLTDEVEALMDKVNGLR